MYAWIPWEIFSRRPHYRRSIETSFFARRYPLLSWFRVFFHFRFFLSLLPLPLSCASIVCVSFVLHTSSLFIALFCRLIHLFGLTISRILLWFFCMCRELDILPQQNLIVSRFFCIICTSIVESVLGRLSYRVNSRTVLLFMRSRIRDERCAGAQFLLNFRSNVRINHHNRIQRVGINEPKDEQNEMTLEWTICVCHVFEKNVNIIVLETFQLINRGVCTSGKCNLQFQVHN